VSTIVNQTPEATLSSDGSIWVVWSGRNDGEGNNWGIYCSKLGNCQWSVPELISSPDEDSRAPSICSDSKGNFWVAWHAGTGSKMGVRLRKLTESV